MLRVILDNTVMNLLSGQAGLPANDLRCLKRGLKRKAAEGEWRFAGGIVLIAEMMGTADARRYSAAFTLCCDLIGGRLLKPWDLRVRDEMKLRRPLREEEALFDPKSATQIYEAAKHPKAHGPILDVVRNEKQAYRRWMKEFEAEHPCPLGLAKGWDVRQWFEDSNRGILDMFAQEFSPKGVPDGAVPARPLSVEEADALPATRSLVRFVAAKLYESQVLHLKAHKGDMYDMSYYIDAVPDGYLVTEDRRLIETCRRIPQRRMGLLRLHSLAALLGEWEIARRLRQCQKPGQGRR